MGVHLVCALLLWVMPSHWPLGFKWRTQLCSRGTIHSSSELLELSLEISYHEKLNCVFTYTSGYFSWCSKCFKCKINHSKFMHFRHCVREEIFFFVATVSNNRLSNKKSVFHCGSHRFYASCHSWSSNARNNSLKLVLYKLCKELNSGFLNQVKQNFDFMYFTRIIVDQILWS